MNIQLQRFLQQLFIEIDISFIAYNDYLEKGRLFSHAKRLKISNDKILDLILKHKHVLPPEQVKNVNALFYHLNVWSSIWDNKKHLLKPMADDIFVFENNWC